MAELVAAYPVGAFTDPQNGNSPIDADEVRANDDALRTGYNSHDADATIHFQGSLLASRPAAGAAGRKWFSSDTLQLFRDNGSSWDEADYLNKTNGGTVAGAVTFTGTFTSTAGLGAGATSPIGWAGRSKLQSPGDGSIVLLDSAGNQLSFLAFGIHADSPAFKNINGGTALAVRRADDSDYADLTVRALTASSTIAGGASVAAAAGSGLGWNGRSAMTSPADGKIVLFNNAQTGFSTLYFGGTTSAFPMFRRSGAELELMVGDALAYGNLTLNTLSFGPSGVVGNGPISTSGQIVGDVLRATGTTGVQSDSQVLATNNVVAGYGAGAGVFMINSTQVLGARKTGWAAPTGTATRSTFATSSVTLPVLAEHVKALIDDLMSHGALGT